MVRATTGIEVTDVDGSLGTASAADRGFYLADDEPRAVGKALRWARARELSRVDLLAEGHAGDLARRASLLTTTADVAEVVVWAVDGAEVEPAQVAEPAAAPVLPDTHWQLAGVMSEAGARPIDDHGVLVGEVAGLEVARVVDEGAGPVIDTGVGQADRELNQLVHHELDADSGLRRVIAAVARHRQADSHHPLTRFARERWLRSMLLDDPTLVGADQLEPLVPLRPRNGLMASEPSAAAGASRSGRPMVVVCMVGVDLDLVPEAADYRARFDPDAEVVLVVPDRDLRLNTTLLTALPSAKAEAVPGPWE